MLLHPKDKKHLKRLAVHLPHGLLITGPSGSGLMKFVSSFHDELRRNSYEINETVFDASGNFGIENIRMLWQKLSYKSLPGNRITVAVFQNADLLKQEAQNALLKTLEEPPKNTLLIVLAQSKYSLLPTITSRLTHVDLSPPLLEQYYSHFAELDEETIEHHYNVTGGWFDRMSELLDDVNTASYAQYVEMVKHVLSLTSLQRLIEVEKLVKDTSLDLNLFLQTFLQVCWSAARSTISKENGLKRNLAYAPWEHRSLLVMRALEDLPKGTNKKILLTDLFLGI